MNRAANVHPGAWWAWALLLALAAAGTSNPLLLVLIGAVAVAVALACRPLGSAAASLRVYFVLAVVVVLIRLVFALVFAAQVPGVGPVVLRLPILRLPISDLVLFGPSHLDSLLGALQDGLRLATLIICVGAAAALASPRKTLAVLPAALRHIGTAVVVALTVFPQLACSVVRVRRTAALRGPAPNRKVAVFRVVFPVVANSLDQSLELAASLEARGYGQATGVVRPWLRHGRLVALLLGTSLLAGGVMAWTGALPLPVWVGAVVALFGASLLGLAMFLMGLGHRPTRYHLQPWAGSEWLVLLGGLAVGIGFLFSAHFQPGSLNPPALAWPPVPWPALVGLVMAATPLLLELVRLVLRPAQAAGEVTPTQPNQRPAGGPAASAVPRTPQLLALTSLEPSSISQVEA
ncbi:MAG: hypothetical protein FWG16_02515 [Micrococcales bacterium]|nr:hypothetical protein [Micrococcales bacterium]